MTQLYPFCLNSRRYIWILFSMFLPKTCKAKMEGGVDCWYEKCPYFEWKKPTEYILEREGLMKSADMDMFTFTEKKEEDE